ncbi:hypothetical protein LY78DRAFT_730863 [Colletotrichum sublineola]|nr:hypothetical protein LY78DRAFT_730863 [Colletotrichum sublineola]
MTRTHDGNGVRHTAKGYGIFIMLIVTPFLILYLSSASPRNPLTTPAARRETEQETDNICSALDALHDLYLRRPASFQDPFSFLGLDPRAPPFDPPESSAHPGAPNHEAARKTVTAAVSRIREPVWAMHLAGEAGAKRVVEATFHVGYVLEDDATRTKYLIDLQPILDKMAKYPGGKWRAASTFCGEFWRRMGWH